MQTLRNEEAVSHQQVQGRTALWVGGLSDILFYDIAQVYSSNYLPSGTRTVWKRWVEGKAIAFDSSGIAVSHFILW